MNSGALQTANTMVSDNPTSPNAIPPRRSSSGLGSGNINPAQPILTPVPEGDWLSQSKKHPATPPSMASSYPPTPGSADSVAKHVHGIEWSQEKEKIILGPFEYLYDHPGKDIRKQFIAAFNAWLKVPEESLVIITKVVGMLHTASLLYVPVLGLVLITTNTESE